MLHGNIAESSYINFLQCYLPIMLHESVTHLYISVIIWFLDVLLYLYILCRQISVYVHLLTTDISLKKMHYFEFKEGRLSDFLQHNALPSKISQEQHPSLNGQYLKKPKVGIELPL